MSPSASLVLFFALLIVKPFPPAAAEALSAYEVLAGYNFPIGLLPRGATGYELDPFTGDSALISTEAAASPAAVPAEIQLRNRRITQRESAH